MKISRVISYFVLFSLAVFFLQSGVLPATASQPTQLEPQGVTDPGELEDFIDGLVESQLASYPIAGMTVSVVKDGELFFAKGYGYADLEERIPVVAEETLFRAGSVSKLFVWTAMMQLVEEGVLDLDADVNTYLDFEIPEAFGEPVTLRHLMIHTPGFEDQGRGLFVSTEEEVNPLGEYLAENIPERVYPPGEITAYSNYGASLAGYIVERVSEMPFHEYVERNIFEPLGMEHSTFRQPVPPELAQSLSKGYRYVGGKLEEGIFEYVQSYPAGSLSATATDLARFMIAHLQDGRYGDARILQEDTARRMRELAFSQDPRLPGWGAGFTVSERDGLQATGHGGDTIFFHSDLILLPDENFGLFVSTNTDRGGLARFIFIEAFLKRYFLDVALERPEPPADFMQRAEDYSGTYYPARRNYSNLEKVLTLLMPLQVGATAERELVVAGLIGTEPTYWVELEPNLFVPISENLPVGGVLLFQPEEGGEGIRYAFFGQNVYIKQPWYGLQGFHFALLAASLAFFLAMIIAAPARALTHRHYRRAAPEAIRPNSPGERLGWWAGWLFALLNIVFLVTFLIVVSDITNVVFGVPPVMEALLIIPWISAVAGIVIVGSAILAWLKGYWTLGGRIFYTLFTLVAFGYLWFLWYWNFLG